MTLLEIFANLFNLVSVFLANRNSVQTWWTGIIGTALFAALFYETKLYADVTLQIFFILTSILGWWNWRRDRQNAELPISRVKIINLVLFVAAAIGLTFGYGFLLFRLTDASYPFVDSSVLFFSIVAQFLLMRRKLEHWYFWILVDAIAVPLYASKELYLTAVIYFAFLVNAVWGFIHWRKLMRLQQQ
jgi:nicotinamide mononucleotide transporter